MISWKRLICIYITALLLVIPIEVLNASDTRTKSFIVRAPCNVMPIELVEIARAKGFVQVTEFFDDKYSVYGPPFVYGVDPEAPDWLSAAFWARKKANKAKYYLVFWYKNSDTEMSKCPDVIEWNSRIGSLTVVDDYYNVAGDDVRYLLDPDRERPALPNLGNAILSESGGIDDLFVCSGGEWKVRTRH